MGKLYLLPFTGPVGQRSMSAGFQICHQSIIDRPYTNFYTHSIVTLALDCFVSEMFTGFVSQIPLLYIPLVLRLSRRVSRCWPRVRSMSSEWARSLLYLVIMLFSENINLFNQGSRT